MALRSIPILTTLLLAFASAAGHAAELGEARVLSHIGQALVADVELTLIENPGTPVAVRLANPNVYRGANIAMPPVLSSLNMTVTRRDGRQLLHLTSHKPVESRHLHLYLELGDGGQRDVRLVTLWLTPDPNPAPAPPPLPLPPPVQAPAAAAAPAHTAPAAQPGRVHRPVPTPRPAAALHAGEEYVETSGRPASRKAVPSSPQKKAAPAPLPAPKAPVDAPSCAPQAANAHLNACVALGVKNAALHQQLGKLEEKVKVLQGGAGVAPVVPAAAGAPVAKAAPKDAPKDAPRIQRKPKKAEPPAAQTPWLWIGVGVAALAAIVGAVLALLGRRKRSRIGKIPAEHKPAKLPQAADAAAVDSAPKPSFIASVKARLMPGRTREAPAEQAAAPAEVLPEQG